MEYPCRIAVLEYHDIYIFEWGHKFESDKNHKNEVEIFDSYKVYDKYHS